MYDSRPSVAPLRLRPDCCTESARCSARFTRLSGSGCVDAHSGSRCPALPLMRSSVRNMSAAARTSYPSFIM